MNRTIKLSISKFQNLWILVIFLVLSGIPLTAKTLQQLPEAIQDFSEFRGTIIDSQSKEPLAFATINVLETNISTITNSDGEFLLKVPSSYISNSIHISFLGYQTKTIPLSSLNGEDIHILLEEAAMQLSEIKINAPKDAKSLVKAALDKKGEYNLSEETVMTAFYRETIKKRRRDASLSEAIVEIYRQPSSSSKADKIKLIKARKSTDYSRLDTLAVKLQGGPFSAIYADVIKYPQFIFNDITFAEYEFSFDKPTEINNRSVYVVKFKQRPNITEPMHYGKLYIDAETFSLISAIYNLNVENRERAAELFVKKKPNRVTVYPTEAAYRVDYRLKDNKWHYGYSNILLTFKVNWKGRLFNSVYTLSSEMAVTDWAKTLNDDPTRRETLRPTVILSEEASGFSDPAFWGEYNIIEPEKSIESAIDKINRHLEKQKETN
ncbi:carboxypeptidase-like regulatory domain-containing protein [Gelidibacter salicanalis]|uniref:Carboxypeptidase-like regulatory domain-containing protein n=1 Tax=Gelidibacter salicanalis TaxID=291193 RepID=A0A934KUP5_9FLAO|nr:carboxypeptidase-like regulatory domain-containing protein [Gelidibacter salicanalis]MBJ7882350.1 carboxypeptidase-like regulatory domain-containing protein [Gelidibacter salicanalis]